MRRLTFILIFSLGGAAILIGLGVWQVQRLAWKQDMLADIDSRIAADPIALPANPDPDADRFLPVAAVGEIGTPTLRILVSVKRIGAGYRLIVPFTLADGRRILLDRGFVPIGDPEPAPPEVPVTVTGNLHWPKESDGFTPEPDRDAGIWFARDLPSMADALKTEPVLLVARSSQPADVGMTPMPVDSAGVPNDHLQYAITWFSLAAIWLAMSVFYMRRARDTERS